MNDYLLAYCPVIIIKFLIYVMLHREVFSTSTIILDGELLKNS